MNDIKDILAQCDNVLPGYGPEKPIKAMLQALADAAADDEYPDIYGSGQAIADFEARVANYMAQLQVFSPPNGRLVLAVVDSEVAGVGCIMTTGERMGEVKHMYVRPQFRRRGLGRKLLGNLVEQSVTMGHTVLRLDSAWFMEAAHALYRSFGFREIAPYPESDVPKEMHDFWIFMEKDLISSTDAIGPSPAQLQRDPR